jgi:diaminopimelate decarboxylase
MIPSFDRAADAVRREKADATGPFCAFLYDLDALARHAARVRAALPADCEFFYAIKANSDLPLLQTLAPYVDGFEASSGGEIAWVRQHFPDTPLIFSGPGKTDDELLLALRHRVTLHVESPHELERLAHLSRHSGLRGSILLRVNPSLPQLATTSLMMGGKPTQFGIAVEHLPGCFARLKEELQLEFLGFHFHLLSHQQNVESHLRLLQAYYAQAHAWCEEFGLKLDHLNAGGGIGVNYREPQRQFDLDRFGAGLAGLRGEAWPGDDPAPRLRFEFGRFISAFCGWYATEVIDLKEAGGEAFAVVRGGTHHFRTPYAQGHSHPFHLLPVDEWDRPYPRPSVTDKPVRVVGQLCTPKDVLAYDARVTSLRTGDLLLFPLAGAYAWHISHHDFLRHPHPAHLYLPVESPASLR